MKKVKELIITNFSFTSIKCTFSFWGNFKRLFYRKAPFFALRISFNFIKKWIIKKGNKS